MLTNYLKIAVRNLTRHKGFSFINIFGLAIRMAGTLLITLWVQNELSIDRTYPKTDRLYLLYNRDKFNGDLIVWNQTPKSIAPALKNDYPSVEDASRFIETRFLASVGDRHLNSRGAIADTGFLHMFDLAMLMGNPATALSGTNSIV